MKFFVLLSLLFGLSLKALGAGYQLRYQGAETMGTAFSSAGSYGSSLSSIYFNPGLFLLQNKDRALALEIMVLHPTESEFTSNNGVVTDDFASTSLSGSLYFGYKIDEDTALTVALTTPWGTKSDYPSGWAGQFLALETELAAFNLQPILSKKLDEKWILSVGPQIQYLDGTLSRLGTANPPNPPFFESQFAGDSLSLGAVVAATYKASDKTTFGFNYTSRIKHQLRGDLTFTPAQPPGLLDSDDADAEIVTPDVFTLGASHNINEKLVGHFSVSYTNWSVFKDLTLNANNVVLGTAPFSNTTAQNWEDTYMVALGTTFNSSEKTSLRGGLSYETGAVENADRTPRTLDTDRLGLGLGASFQVSGIKLDLALNHIFYLGDIELQQPSFGAVGSYDNAATLFRVGAEYNF